MSSFWKPYLAHRKVLVRAAHLTAQAWTVRNIKQYFKTCMGSRGDGLCGMQFSSMLAGQSARQVLFFNLQKSIAHPRRRGVFSRECYHVQLLKISGFPAVPQHLQSLNICLDTVPSEGTKHSQWGGEIAHKMLHILQTLTSWPPALGSSRGPCLPEGTVRRAVWVPRPVRLRDFHVQLILFTCKMWFLCPFFRLPTPQAICSGAAKTGWCLLSP